jgi:sortase A
MNQQQRIAELRHMLRLIVVICLASAAIMLAIGFWIPAKAAVAQHLLEHAWNEVRAGKGETKPWPWADTSPLARLSIPSLDASWIVLSGVSGRTLAFAPGHMDGSALPGAAGVTVIAGHRDTHFDVLEDLAIGTVIALEATSGEIHHFVVKKIQIVDSTAQRIRLDADRPQLLLTTCYPFDSLTPGGPLRWLVTAAIAEPGE